MGDGTVIPTRLLWVAQLARLLDLHWHTTVKAIGRLRLRTDVGGPGRRVVHQLVIEEFALFRRQRYGTVAACADTQRALWLRGSAAGEGRAYARRSVGGPFPATFRGISFVRADRQSCRSVEPGVGS
jgi:hypothetical protein